MTKIRLLNAHCLVRPDDPVTRLGSVELPDFLQRKAAKGTVVAVGQYYFNNGTKMDFNLKPGDRVQYRPQDGDLQNVGEEQLLMLGLSQLIGVLEEEEE
jgi:co-chaperonin GroES (HSP10)